MRSRCCFGSPLFTMKSPNSSEATVYISFGVASSHLGSCKVSSLVANSVSLLSSSSEGGALGLNDTLPRDSLQVGWASSLIHHLLYSSAASLLSLSAATHNGPVSTATGVSGSSSLTLGRMNVP